MRKRTATFVIMFFWDYVTALSIQFIAAGGLASVPVAAIITAFWWIGIGQVKDLKSDKISFVLACLGAALGTWAGISWP